MNALCYIGQFEDTSPSGLCYWEPTVCVVAGLHAGTFGPPGPPSLQVGLNKNDQKEEYQEGGPERKSDPGKLLLPLRSRLY